MTVSKCVVTHIDSAYSTGTVSIEGKTYVLAASEGHAGHAVLIDPRTFSFETMWTGPGGTMAVVGTDDRRFLSIDGFYPVFDSADAAVSLTVIEGGEAGHSFTKTKLFPMPWCHRVALVHEKDGDFIICGTLSDHKDSQQDWSKKGSVWVAPFDGKKAGRPQNIFPARILRHHAMSVHRNADGTDDCYVGGQDGAFRVSRENGKWKVAKVLGNPTSEIAVADLDGDGEDEMAIIEDFHGNTMRIFKDGREIVSCSFTFGHVLWGGKIGGKPRIILGTRGGDKDLRILSLVNRGGAWHLEGETLDTGTGPTQIAVLGNTVYAVGGADGNIAAYRIED